MSALEMINIETKNESASLNMEPLKLKTSQAKKKEGKKFSRK